MTALNTTSSLLAEVQSDRGLECLVYDNRATWLPDIADLEQRSAAAIAYVHARRAGIDRPEARDLARAAIGDDATATAERLAALRAQAEEAAKSEAARAAAEAAQAELRATAITLNTHDLKTVLAAALKHTEYSRFHNAGSWSNKRWRLSVNGSTASTHLTLIDRDSAAAWNSPNPHWVITAANDTAYQALVSILGRRSWNRGGGVRHDVTPETPTDKTRLALARSIIARKKVSVKKLMSIQDTHARAWAVELTGGWGRMAKLMSVVEKTKEGTLLNGVPAGLDSDLLLVTCPSTGSRYALMVPRPPRAKSRTVKNALKAVNGLDSKNIVAQS